MIVKLVLHGLFLFRFLGFALGRLLLGRFLFFLPALALRSPFPAFQDSHVRDVDGALALRDLALRIVLRLLQVLLDHPHAFDQHPLLARDHFEHLPGRATMVPRDHLDVVAFPDVQFKSVHNTSGASETIFMKLRSRSSRATGPKIRVPRGFKSLSITTMALLSKRRTEPSLRLIGCRVRTTTARITSPFFTVPVALASFTFAVITSPIPADCAPPLPMTPIIVAMRAPLLSATSSLLRMYTITISFRYFWTTS